MGINFVIVQGLFIAIKQNCSWALNSYKYFKTASVMFTILCYIMAMNMNILQSNTLNSFMAINAVVFNGVFMAMNPDLVLLLTMGR
jgi:hypothetical protein